MLQFSYIAHTMDGAMRKGGIEAQDMEEARERLRKSNLTVDEIHRSTLAEQHAPSQEPTPASQARIEDSPLLAQDPARNEPIAYVPLTDTMRLYAGWLLAWYSMVYLLGSYQTTKQLPFEIPFVQGLFLSPLVLSFAFGTYLFLLLTSIHRSLGRSLGRAVVLTMLGISLFVLFSVNM